MSGRIRINAQNGPACHCGLREFVVANRLEDTQSIMIEPALHLESRLKMPRSFHGRLLRMRIAIEMLMLAQRRVNNAFAA